MPTKREGAVIYDGPSTIDGSPILVIVTGMERPTANPKTGPMAQTWIVARDVAPRNAILSGADAAVCGSCPLRAVDAYGAPQKRACYVRTEGITGAWLHAQRSLPHMTPAEAAARIDPRWGLRIGSYGDPGAVPIDVWHGLLSVPRRHTGYTHLWRGLDFATWGRILMASCDSPADAVLASSRGWRTFRIGTDPLQDEIRCPASKEAGHRSTCNRCGLCDGARSSSDRRKSIMINPH